MIDRSAIGPRVLVSVAELLAVVGSIAPVGAAMLAVLMSDPEPAGEIFAVSVKVTFPPTGMFTDALIDPVPEAGHDAPVLAAHVHVAPVRTAGNVSVTVAPMAADGPLLVATMV